MRLGFVGVGRWAQKLATAFRACGAEIVAYDRHNSRLELIHRNPERCDCGHLRGDHADQAGGRCFGLGRWFGNHDDMLNGGGNSNTNSCDAQCGSFQRSPLTEPSNFGRYMPWRAQLADKSIDAIVAVAPPEITTQVALACAAAGKPVMATKPLFDHPERITAPFYVDFWRLWSHAQAERISPLIQFVGSGPIREFSGIDDYGPHVMAALLAADLPIELTIAGIRGSGTQETAAAQFKVQDEKVSVVFGNLETPESPAGRSWFGHYEGGETLGRELKSTILRRFCQSFLNDISEGFVDTRLLNLSRDGMRELRKIREMAKPSG